MEKEPLISVVIPCYNREKVIAASVRSVLGQTYRNIEVIVVDDGSEDASVETLSEIRDDRLLPCVLFGENRGACAARNAGADLASGEYIAFQDSDDIWLPEKLEKQLAFLREGGYDMVFCALRRVNPFTGEVRILPPYDFDGSKNSHRQLLMQNCASTQCIFIRREAFGRIRFDEAIKKCQDWDFAIRASAVLKLGYMKEVLVHAELQENSVSRVQSRYDALLALYNKYNGEILADSAVNARYLKKMGDCFYGKDEVRAADYYRSSLKARISPKVFAKWCMSRLRGKRDVRQ